MLMDDVYSLDGPQHVGTSFACQVVHLDRCRVDIMTNLVRAPDQVGERIHLLIEGMSDVGLALSTDGDLRHLVSNLRRSIEDFL